MRVNVYSANCVVLQALSIYDMYMFNQIAQNQLIVFYCEDQVIIPQACSQQSYHVIQ